MTVDQQVRGLKISGLVIVAVMVASIVAFGIRTDWYGFAAPRFQPGVQYEFVYSNMAKAAFGDLELETRVFQVDQETIFTALAKGPRGEQAVIEDSTLPPNTFIYTKKMVSAVVLGSQLFQDEYTFVETRYNMVQKEHQSVVPLVPKRR